MLLLSPLLGDMGRFVPRMDPSRAASRSWLFFERCSVVVRGSTISDSVLSSSSIPSPASLLLSSSSSAGCCGARGIGDGAMFVCKRGKADKPQCRINCNIKKTKTSQVKEDYQNWRTASIKRPNSAGHLCTMGHTGNDLHKLLKLFLIHRRVVIASVIFKPSILPQPPSSGLKWLNSPTNKKSDKIHSI